MVIAEQNLRNPEDQNQARRRFPFIIPMFEDFDILINKEACMNNTKGVRSVH